MVHRVVVIGPAGGGKTTLVQDIVRCNPETHFQVFDAIPVPDNLPNNANFIATAFLHDVETVQRLMAMGALCVRATHRYH